MAELTYPLTVDTVGKLIDAGHHLQASCEDCGGLSVNMELLAAKIGRDYAFVGRNFPLRCPLCGNRITARIGSGPLVGGAPEVTYG